MKSILDMIPVAVVASVMVLAFSVGLKADTPIPIPPDVAALIEHAKPPATVELRRFESLHDAAISAAGRLEECSLYYECSGSIALDSKGKFVVGPVRTDYASDHVAITSFGMPPDWTLAGGIHSHPCLPDHAPEFFSPEDMIGAITTRSVMFMVDLCTGEVHEFIPGETKPDEEEADDGMWLTRGRIIGHVAAFKDQPHAKEGI